MAWTYPFGETGSNPIVVRGTIYGRGRNGAIVALDAKSGKEIWIHDGMTGMTARGMNYWESKDGKDRRLIFAMNDYLQEIDAATGKSILTFGSEGVVDLREGLGREWVTPVGDAGAHLREPDPPGIGHGRCRRPAISALTTSSQALSPGSSTRFRIQASSGTRRGRLTPGSMWAASTHGEKSRSTTKEASRLPTGSPTYNYYGADRPGANLFSDCLLALDARTGKRLWHFQSVHHELLGLDNNSAPQLLTIKRDGKSVDVVAMAGKTGFLYVFDRVTGKPVWPIEERPVPKKRDGGRADVAHAAVPDKSPAVQPTTFTADDINPHAAAARTATRSRSGCRRPATMASSLPSASSTRCRSPATTAVRYGQHGRRSRDRHHVCSEPRQPVGPAVDKPGEGRGGPGGGQAGLGVYLRECESCHGPTRAGSENGPSLLSVPDRLDIEAIRSILSTGKGRMPAFSHLTSTDVDALAALLLTPTAVGRGAAFRSDLPPGPVVASGGAKARAATGRGGRGGPIPYPEGVTPTERSVIDAYGTIGIMMKPPFTKLTRYDLNAGTIKWQVGLGDDARLTAEGIKGTGVRR